MEEGFGKANLDREYDGPKMFRVPTPKAGEEKGVIEGRLIPPMKSMAKRGQWRAFHRRHFGHEGNNPRDPQKGLPRPYICIEEKDRNGNVTVSCPKCVQMDRVYSMVEAREDELARENGIENRKSREWSDLRKNDAKLKSLNDWLKRHNCDKKFYVNFMNNAGELGVLAISYTTMTKKLEPLLKKLRDENRIDAFDPAAGVYLRFTRTGKGLDVNDEVEVVTEPQQDGSFRYKRAPMTEEQIKRALSICPDLSNCNQEICRVLPAVAIQALVDCKGSKDEVDAIWAPYDREFKGSRGGDDRPAPVSVPSLEEAAQKPSGAPKAPAQASAPPTAAPDPADELAVLQARMDALKAKQAAASTPAPAAPTQAPVQHQPVPELGVVEGPDDFLRQFEAK